MAASVGKKLAFTAILAVGALGLAEGLARLVPIPTDTSNFRPDDLLCSSDCLDGAASLPVLPKGLAMQPLERVGWAFKPNSQDVQGNVVVDINRLGLRGPDPELPKPAGRVRVMTLGDSSIFGYGVEDEQVFAAVALSELPDADLVTGAIPGHDTHQSLAVLESIGAEVHPDVVLIGNLWSDLYHEPQSEGPRYDFALYRHAVRLLTPFLEPRKIGWLDEGSGAGVPGPRKLPRTGLGVYQVNLALLASTARGLGAEPVFVLLPSPWDATGEQVPDWVATYRESMRAVADEVDAELLDGPELFVDHPSGLKLFFDQVHPSEEGHQLLGEALAPLVVAAAER